MENTQQQDGAKSVLIQVSSATSSFLETHGDIILSALRNTFRENLHLTVIKKEQIHVKGSINTLDKLNIILMNDPVKIIHSSGVKSWLSENSASWLTFINSLTMEYLCAICTVTDFSESYILLAPHHNEQVLAKINAFLPFKEIEALPEDKNTGELPEVENFEKSSPVFVYECFADYLKDDKEMAPILGREKQSPHYEPLVEIHTSKKSLKVLKSRLEMVSSQSCLLNASQAKSFSAFGDKILSDIQRNYQVIGNVFRSAPSMNRVILNHQTDIICIVCSEHDCCPVDNYIDLKCSIPENTAAKKCRDKIWRDETWNLPYNQMLHVELPLMQTDDELLDFKTALGKCFQILDYDNSFTSKITGIHLTFKNPKVLNQFCSHLIAALQSFDPMHRDNPSYKCIAVMVGTPEIQLKITETILEMSKGKSEGSDERRQDSENVLLGAIPKTSKRTQQKIHGDEPEIRGDKPEIQGDRPDIQRDQQVLWVQLSNFSGTPENLRLAVKILMEKLTENNENKMISHDIKIHRNKLESILFFFGEEIFEFLPDFKDQLAKSQGDIITLEVPETFQNIRQKFKKQLKKIPKIQVDVQGIQEKTFLNSIVSQCNHEFPNMKCTYLEEKSIILIESFDSKDLQMVARKIKSQLDQPPYLENPNSGELPGNIQENFEAGFESGHRYSALSYLTIKVLCNNILSVDAEAIACPVSSCMAQNSFICELILCAAGVNVKEELMNYYEEYDILPEGEVIITSAGNLGYKLIIFVCYPQCTDQKDDNNIQQILAKCMCNLLMSAEKYEVQSLAFPILDSGGSNVPSDLCLNACLDGIASFVNQLSNKHLRVVSLVDNQEKNCDQIMDFLRINKIPFVHNLEREKPKRPVREQKQRTRRQAKLSLQPPVYKQYELPGLLQPEMRCLVPCPVCFKLVTKPKKFDDCQHEYCSECIKEWLMVIGQVCPLCMNMNFQPPGEMMVKLSERCLPGFEEFQTYKITYKIPDGIQQSIHPNPGKMYHGTMRQAYLPASEEGKCLLKMLQRAFKQHLIFNVGSSLSSGMSDVVIWNGILHKTRRIGGPSAYGYPDPLYMDFVISQLVEIGITPESVESEKIEPEIKMTAFS